jgi:hypothetical protein
MVTPIHKQLIPPATGYEKSGKDHTADIGLLPTPTSQLALLAKLSASNPRFQPSAVRHARPPGSHVRIHKLQLPNYIETIARAVFGPDWNSERRNDSNAMLEHLYLIHILTSAWQKATDPACPTYISGIPIEASEIPHLDAMLDTMYDHGTTFNALPITQQTLLREILRRMLLQYNNVDVHRAWISNHRSQAAADTARVDLVQREAAHRATADTTVLEGGFRRIAVARAVRAAEHANMIHLQQLMHRALQVKRNLRTERDDATQQCSAARDLELVTKETAKQEIEQLEAKIEEQAAELHRAEEAARQMRTENHIHILEAARGSGSKVNPKELTRQIEEEAERRRDELETLKKQRDDAVKMIPQFIAVSERAQEAVELAKTMAEKTTKEAVDYSKALEARLDCVICQTNERNTMLSPCHHMACCDTCWDRWIQTPQLDAYRQVVPASQTCPICRAPVTLVTRVFLN